MQANDPSPHAVFVLQVATPWAFDLWLHVSIEAFQFHLITFHSCRCTVRCEVCVSFHNWNFKLMLSASFGVTRQAVGKAKAIQAICQSRVDFAVHEFISVFATGPCIPVVTAHKCLCVWLNQYLLFSLISCQ